MIKKQFIAGARCPHCNAIDKIKFCTEGEREWLECVACQKITTAPAPAEYPTQANDEGVVKIFRHFK